MEHLQWAFQKAKMEKKKNTWDIKRIMEGKEGDHKKSEI